MNELTFYCPYCGEENVTSVYPEDGSKQSLLQDCEVCCRPLEISFVFSGNEIISLNVDREND